MQIQVQDGTFRLQLDWGENIIIECPQEDSDKDISLLVGPFPAGSGRMGLLVSLPETSVFVSEGRTQGQCYLIDDPSMSEVLELSLPNRNLKLRRVHY